MGILCRACRCNLYTRVVPPPFVWHVIRACQASNGLNATGHAVASCACHAFHSRCRLPSTRSHTRCQAVLVLDMRFDYRLCQRRWASLHPAQHTSQKPRGLRDLGLSSAVLVRECQTTRAYATRRYRHTRYVRALPCDAVDARMAEI